MKASLRNDVELLAVVLFWAFNLPVVKVGLREVQPLAYNLVRFACASAVLLTLTRLRDCGRSPNWLSCYHLSLCCVAPAPRRSEQFPYR